jgi:hypothetical protein
MGSADVRLLARTSNRLPATSCFASLETASAFFAAGSVGYSATRNGARLDGLALRTLSWRIEPLDVHAIFSHYFTDPSRFPPGSVTFDSALLMRNLAHEWHPVQPMRAEGWWV